jgi:hypothetical protein
MLVLLSQEIEQAKDGFYTWLYNGYCKFYSCKGPEGLPRFERGAKVRIEELSGSAVIEPIKSSKVPEKTRIKFKDLG